MMLPSGPINMDRTAELYAKLDESLEGEARMILEQFDFVLAPVALGKSRRVSGPADVLVLRSEASDVLVAGNNVTVMHVIFTGKQPEQKVYNGRVMRRRTK